MFKPLNVTFSPEDPVETFTGDPSKWPVGVYRCNYDPDYVVVVSHLYGEWLSTDGGQEDWDKVTDLGYRYTRVKGATVEWTPAKEQKNFVVNY